MTLQALLRAERAQLLQAAREFTELAGHTASARARERYRERIRRTLRAARRRQAILTDARQLEALLPAFRRRQATADFRRLHAIHHRWCAAQTGPLERALFQKRPAIPPDRPACSPCARKLWHHLQEELTRDRPAPDFPPLAPTSSAHAPA